MAMSFEKKIMKTTELVKSKLTKDFTAHISYKGNKTVENAFNGTDFIFHSYDKGSSWHLYQGCDLVIGDVSLGTCVIAMLDVCNERF